MAARQHNGKTAADKIAPDQAKQWQKNTAQKRQGFKTAAFKVFAAINFSFSFFFLSQGIHHFPRLWYNAFCLGCRIGFFPSAMRLLIWDVDIHCTAVITRLHVGTMTIHARRGIPANMPEFFSTDCALCTQSCGVVDAKLPELDFFQYFDVLGKLVIILYKLWSREGSRCSGSRCAWVVFNVVILLKVILYAKTWRTKHS